MNSIIEISAPAKINLWLRVLAREDSGFHSIETLFAAVSLADRLTIKHVPEAGIALAAHGIEDVGPVENNLVHRAAMAFIARGTFHGGVHIELEKRIPTAAGLGGGSSDAAATLRGMNQLFGEPFRPVDLLDMAIRLGSDVPFFLAPTPFALAWGRGERLFALDPLPVRRVLIAHPGQAMPTGEAFRRLAERRGSDPVPHARVVTAREVESWGDVARLAENDFETVAFERLPELAKARALLLEGGASVALLAGSGASMFGVFERVADLVRAASDLEARGWRCWHEETLEAWPIPDSRD